MFGSSVKMANHYSILLHLLCLLFAFTSAQRNPVIVNLTSSSGSFVSPNHPNNYLSNSSYIWNIIQPIGTFITLTFDDNDFAVEGYASTPCKYDWVVVVESDDIPFMKDCSVPPLGTSFTGLFCNYHMPPTTLALSTNVVAIQFCSDIVVEDKGFTISYTTSQSPPTGTTAVPPTTPTPTPFTTCGSPGQKISNGDTYTFSSPNYPPGPYPNDADCTWKFTSTASVVHIKSLFFSVEGYSSDCYYDRLSITDNYGETKVYCMSNGPNVQLSGQTPFTFSMNFVSDDQIQFPGFQIDVIGQQGQLNPVDPQCGATFTLPSADDVILYSPGWPYEYRSNLECMWTIINSQAANGQSIQFQFMSFDTEIDHDILKVVGDDGIVVEIDGKMATNSTEVFTTSSLTAEFTTDGNINRPGFAILVTLVPTPFSCGDMQFRCRTGQQCISASKLCDGSIDCDDASDETALICNMNTTCGMATVQPNIHITNFIVNGSQAKPFSWPWMVGLYRKSADYLFCGGTLIEPRWVLTSARCVYNDNGNPSVFVAKVGSYEMNVMSQYEVDSNITTVVIHPKFNPITYENDIALLLLESYIKISGYVNAACLPRSAYEIPAPYNCVVTGWGQTKGTGNNTVLRQAIASVIPNNVCNDTNHYNGKIDDSQICAGDDDGGKVGICQTDFGGPLACPDSNGRFYVQGIASQNDGQADCVQPHKPGIFTRTSAFIDFITQTMEEYTKN